MKDQGTNFKSMQQLCFHNQQGECHYLECDVVRCNGICNMWCSFNKELKSEINKKIKEKVGSTDPVTKYELDKAFSYQSSDATIQGVLRDE